MWCGVLPRPPARSTFSWLSLGSPPSQEITRGGSSLDRRRRSARLGTARSLPDIAAGNLRWRLPSQREPGPVSVRATALDRYAVSYSLTPKSADVSQTPALVEATHGPTGRSI
jgi:hypothetical protein